MKRIAHTSKRMFLFNTALLLVVLGLGALWFVWHLQPFLTQMLIVGGTFTLWAAVSFFWDRFVDVTEAEPMKALRSWLATSAATPLLCAGIGLAGGALIATQSIYFHYAGDSPFASDRTARYLVRIIDARSGAPFIRDIEVSAAEPVAGRPFFGFARTLGLRCQIVAPAGFQTRDCSLAPMQHRALDVPGAPAGDGFARKELHLLRLIPVGAAYQHLPMVEEQPEARYDLTVQLGGGRFVLKDLRRQTVYAGVQREDMAIAMTFEDANNLREGYLLPRLLTSPPDFDDARLSAAVLSTWTRQWPAFYVRRGDVLTLSLTRRGVHGQQDAAAVFPGFPIQYAVTDEQVQTIWLPPRV